MMTHWMILLDIKQFGGFKMKRIIALLLTTLCLIVSLSVCVSADDLLITVFIDGKQVEFDVPPMLNGG